MIADLFLLGLGLAAGVAVAAYWFYRARVAEADLRDAQARLAAKCSECEAEHGARERLEATIDGADVRGYWPRPLSLGGRRW